jgi:aspartate aminotransferase-like enzyme
MQLFIPGPTEVKKTVLHELSKSMIGHRSKDFMTLYKETTKILQKLMYTKNPVLLATSSATGIWEACSRNLVKKCLCCVNGAFSEKWYQTILLNGKLADKLEVEWGESIKPEEVDNKLKTGDYDALSLVHNETSTGVMNPLEDISEVMKKYPHIIFMVDAVSSLGGVKLEVDNLGIDVCLASVQKALAIPPGLSLFSLSNKAYEKSLNQDNKGYYFNFEILIKYHEKNQTLSTPPISQIYALNYQLQRIFDEGLENRFKRHKEMAEFVRNWGRFDLFAEQGYESTTLTCFKNSRNIDVSYVCEKLNQKGYVISNGYGPLKNKTFRIAHMGDIALGDLKNLLIAIDGEL